jgi:hypothetical protein
VEGRSLAIEQFVGEGFVEKGAWREGWKWEDENE